MGAPWQNELYLVNSDGTGLRRLTRSRGDKEAPAWSPDGKRIALAWLKPASGFVREFESNIYIINADGTGLRNLSKPGLLDGWMGFGWSPDGRWIVCTSERHEDSEIYIVSADGKRLKRLTYRIGRAESPAWSPDGKKIVFVSDRFVSSSEVYADICVVNADGSAYKTLTTSPARDGHPSWSPDGKKLLFVREWRGPLDGMGYTLNASEMWVMNADGTAQVPLGQGWQPSWSPDGTRIAFERLGDPRGVYDIEPDGTMTFKGPGNPAGIYVTYADGTGLTNVTMNMEGDHQPAWSPDGARIAFVRAYWEGPMGGVSPQP